GKTPKGTIEKENSWGLRLREARCWGHTLESQEVLDQSITAKLVNTLKDHRAADDAALRRATLRALAPAAAKGSRKALDAQAGRGCHRERSAGGGPIQRSKRSW
ncbi:unnamed protein product, partial [Prorocentrum cordatum]